MKTSFLKSLGGNESSTRLMTLIIVLWAMALTSFIVVMAMIAGTESVMLVSAAAVSTFSGLTAAVLIWNNRNKKLEGEQEAVKA